VTLLTTEIVQIGERHDERYRDDREEKLLGSVHNREPSNGDMLSSQQHAYQEYNASNQNGSSGCQGLKCPNSSILLFIKRQPDLVVKMWPMDIDLTNRGNFAEGPDDDYDNNEHPGKPGK
jgi:hypothetical protein